MSPGRLTYECRRKHTKSAKQEHASFCGSRRCRGEVLGEEEE